MPRFGVRLARGVALSLVAIIMHVDPGTHAMHVIGIATREGIDGGAVLGLDHEQAADRGLAELS
jgi:hypothetical protein